ncbi:MAG: exosortase-associated EpsI family protein [Planctomycetaceae bacterium]|nr:exosortase-associated EpsI family protein [Planctomycetaceae bacterium]
MLSTAAAERAWMPARGSDAEMKATVAQLAQVPSTVGDWIGRDLPLDAAQSHAAAVAGGLVREYTHRQTGRSLTVTLLVGPVPAIAVHPPTACFRGQGYQRVGEPMELPVDAGGSRHTFQAARFVAPGPLPHVTEVAWGWCGDRPGSVWSAPRFPRWTFAGRPWLKKLYVTCGSEPHRGEGTDGPSAFQEKETEEFLERIAEITSRL